MRGPFFKSKLAQKRIFWGPDESIEDIETMYSIIVEARREYNPSGNVKSKREDERIALISICSFSWPGKYPKYITEATDFRLSQKGITEDIARQLAFREIFKPVLIQSRSVEEMLFHTISDVFDIEGFGGVKMSGGDGSVPPPSFEIKVEADDYIKIGNQVTRQRSSYL